MDGDEDDRNMEADFSSIEKEERRRYLVVLILICISQTLECNV
jgi:hypothetical protein